MIRASSNRANCMPQNVHEKRRLAVSPTSRRLRITVEWGDTSQCVAARR